MTRYTFLVEPMTFEVVIDAETEDGAHEQFADMDTEQKFRNCPSVDYSLVSSEELAK